ncbi:MAG: hypothetical protein BroJett011_08030 [Chloroflexota bacterium]|nr:MAG: hypothetical protein BroJett011_08030 [Chloroflexota bacterium]
MLSLLEITADETIVEALEGRNVRFKIEGETILVDPDDLPVPMIFGISTDHVGDDVESFDWSGWYEQWD